MEQEAEQEAARQEAEEAERQAAEAEAGDVATGVDGDVMINGEEPKQETPSLIAPPPATDAEVDDSVVE
jgi:hypothetical protein